MPVPTRKKITVQYRKLEDLTGAFGATNLQAALSACLKEARGSETIGDDASCRLINEDGYGTLVLNSFEDKTNFFFGEIVRFEPGANLPLLQMASGAKEYNLTQAKAPDGHEPIRGMIYFMAIKNHVVLIENDVSARRAEQYFSWLLTEATSTLPKGVHVILLATLSASGGAIQLNHVEEIIVKPQPISADGLSLADDNGTALAAKREVSETNALEVLKAAGMDDADIQRLAMGNTQLEITLQIKFKDQRRKRSLSIEDTNRLLRNLPEDELTLKGPGGRQKNGKIEKLAYPANVELFGSLLKRKDVIRALNEGFQHFLNNGYIDG